MNENYEFLISKINQLEMKIFELEKKIKVLENSQVELNKEDQENSKINTRIERYKFNGEVYKKGRLVLAIIKKYVENNPNTTLSELSSAFPGYEFKSSYECVMDVRLIPERMVSPVKRYFVDEPIILADGTSVAVCTQWGTNTKYFIDYVTKKYGFVIEKVMF